MIRGWTTEQYQEELAKARKKAHLYFDRLWFPGAPHTRRQRRVGAYNWLRKQTGMSIAECHFSKFDIGMCEAAIQLVQMAEIGLIERPRMPSINGKPRKKLEKKVRPKMPR